MKKLDRKFYIAAGALILIGICVVVAILLYFPQRVKAVFSRPLVLIHSPLNRDNLEIGRGVIVHATARNQKGITRAELWVDDTLVSTQMASTNEGGAVNPLVFSTDWQPTTAGEHTLLVRAFSADQVPGQSTIRVEAFEPESATELASHIVEEGQTLESIAEEYGLSPEELSDLNPDLPAGGLAPGDSLDVPAGGGETEEEGASEPSEPSVEAADDVTDDTIPAPVPDDDAPGASLGILPLLFGLDLADIFGGTLETESMLRMEILSFETEPAFADTNCYVSLGDGPWDIAELERATRFFHWPPDQPLPFSVDCVGIATGGTDSVELGLAATRIPPETWDGIARRVNSLGGEGSFTIEYRLQWEGLVEKDPDPDMTIPTNVRLDDRRISLRWDYLPEPEEQSIHGFRIYLNENLQWIEPADAHESGLPYEWFNPPCETQYNFTVTAYRQDFSEDSESYHSEPAVVETPAEGCTREIQISFLELETFNLGGDGRYEDRTGDVGPPYGTFHANERTFSFDASGRDHAHGLSHNHTYDLYGMSADSRWGFSGMPSLIVDVPPGGTFEFGYRIMDSDTGRCRQGGILGEWNCDDLICEGLSMYYNDRYGVFDEWHEDSLTSENGRCRVTYRWGPAFGSPVGSGVEGEEPLPWLEVEEVFIDETTERMQIELQNTGSATWPWKDLDVEFSTRDGESIAIHTWPEFVLETGESTVIEPPVEFSPPFDICVQIDPFDRVPEGPERSGYRTHQPICPRLPDLTISNVRYDGILLVTVQNIGDGAVENRTIHLEAVWPDGIPGVDASVRNITLGPSQSQTFALFGSIENMRIEDMRRRFPQEGYSVVVDPDNTIAETSTENNTYHIPGIATILLQWCDTIIPHYHGYGHTVRLDLTATAITGSLPRTLLTEHVRDYFSYLYIDDYDTHYAIGDRAPGLSCFRVDTFKIMGDELLQVEIAGEYLAGRRGGSWDNLNAGSQIFLPEDNWGAAVETDCGPSSFPDRSEHRFLIEPSVGMLVPQPWETNFALTLCPEE